MKIATSQLGCPTPVLHHLRPLSTTSSPSTAAVACMLVASEEATSGSVMQKADLISPASRGVSQRSRCACEPKCSSTSMLPVSGALQLKHSLAISERPMRSASGAYSTFARPAPCSASGRNRFHRPSALAFAFSSSISGATTHGAVRASCSRWCASSCGLMCSAMKASTRSSSSRVRAEGAKSTTDASAHVQDDLAERLASFERLEGLAGLLQRVAPADYGAHVALLDHRVEGGADLARL